MVIKVFTEFYELSWKKFFSEEQKTQKTKMENLSLIYPQEFQKLSF